MMPTRSRPPVAVATRPLRLFGAVFLAGCGASGSVAYTPAMAVNAAPKAFGDEMMTYLVPAKPFAVAGHFQTQDFDTPDVALLALRQKAASLNLDGISRIQCGGGKTFNWVLSPAVNSLINVGKNGDCVGEGFVWVKR
jgi:hypothetical protein